MEILAEFLGFCFNLLIGMFIYSLVRGFLTSYENKITADVDELKDRLRKMIHFVRLEQHGEQLYWFDEETDEFLGQGHTLEDIIVHVKNRFPTHVFVDQTANRFMRAPEWRPLPISELKKLNAVDL
jgi:hypothetical protein